MLLCFNETLWERFLRPGPEKRFRIAVGKLSQQTVFKPCLNAGYTFYTLYDI